MSLGIWQIILIIVLILLLFGRNKISALMGDLGKGITSFKKGLAEGGEKTTTEKEKKKAKVQSKAMPSKKAPPKRVGRTSTKKPARK